MTSIHRPFGSTTSSAPSAPYGGTCPDADRKGRQCWRSARFLSTGDYHLQADSPGIDRGTRYEGFETDLEGESPRHRCEYLPGWISRSRAALEYVPQPPGPPDPVMASSLADGALLAWNAFDAARATSSPDQPNPGTISRDRVRRWHRYEDRSVTVGTVYWYSVAGTNRWGIGSGTSPVAMRAANPRPRRAGPDAWGNRRRHPVRTDLLANDRDPEADEFTGPSSTVRPTLKSAWNPRASCT